MASDPTMEHAFEPQGYQEKLREMLTIEAAMQRRWDAEKIFEVDAPAPGSEDDRKEKYMTSFPFPYMNGKAHLGHTFTFSKCEFSAGFQRMLGKRCTFPFAMHCTGMPIKACADKLKREMEEFGFPPQFAEQADSLYQWQIMASLGLTDDEIKPFAAAEHWLTFFPLSWISDMKRMGVKVDWRRNYISTDANPFFDSFVHWTFLRLKERNRVKFGRRYTIFSPKEGQPCMDHDRSSGEEVGLREFTVAKLKLRPPYPAKLTAVGSKSVYLLAATQRPETLSGQTSCWVHPNMEYVAMETRTGNIYVCSRRAGLNLSYQDVTSDPGLKVVVELTGQDIMGAALDAPLSRHKTLYTLPKTDIPNDKGTDILPGVPADSPDDVVALRELRDSQSLREQYGLTDEMLADCEGQNGEPEVSPSSHVDGQSGEDVRTTLQAHMVSKGEALIYMEPEQRVMSRSGSECVAALCDQWYLDYGAADWRAMSQRCLARMNLFYDAAREQFERSVSTLGEHACSRTDGLGSRIPWDRRYLIENMSDSNINMAYYTVCPLLQGYHWDGSQAGPAGIRPEQLTPEVWDYIMLKDKPYPCGCDIPRATLDALRREFEYWYPVDDRISGKDLIPNNLTYYIYGHTAMWPEDESKWPKAIRANGHLLINSKKMSKSTGNFCTLKEAIERFSADGMRLTLAAAGDGLEDADFREREAQAGLLSLHAFLAWVREMIKVKASLRRGDNSFWDIAFASEISDTIRQTREHYEKHLYKEAANTGFFGFQLKLGWYREMEPHGMHYDLVFRFIEIQALLVAPICPHMAECVWGLLGKTESVMWAAWPDAGQIDHSVLAASRHLRACLKEFKARHEAFMGAGDEHQNILERPTHATVWVARPFLTTVTTQEEGQSENYQTNGKAPDLAGSDTDPVLDEVKLFTDNSDCIVRVLGLVGVEVRTADGCTSDDVRQACSPGKPVISFDTQGKLEN